MFSWASPFFSCACSSWVDEDDDFAVDGQAVWLALSSFLLPGLEDVLGVELSSRVCFLMRGRMTLPARHRRIFSWATAPGPSFSSFLP